MDEDDEEIGGADTDAPKKGGGIIGLVIALVAVTVVGGGGGAAVAMMQYDKIFSLATKRANEAPTVKDTALAWDESTAVARLEPIIANLAEPSGTWIRLQTAMVFDREGVDDVERLKATVTEETLAFLRTVTLGELTGPSAFNYLRDDLDERAQLASGGVVSELIIENMVLQ